MARLGRGRKKRLILDIGTSAIRLCELSQTKSGYQLVKFYQKEYNSDPNLDEDERNGLRSKALADILKESKVRTKKTIFGVPGQSVFTRSRTLPPVPEYKVAQIVRYEIQQQIPFALDQIAMDYQVLEKTEAGGYEVMMAAIKVDVVDKHLVALQEAKRSIEVVDVSPLAAYNWLKHTGEFGDQGECVALIDIGATTTDIVVERENQFRFTRPLNVGGNDITKAIAAEFGMNFIDAERVKRQRGSAPTGDPKVDGKGGEVIGNILDRLVGEIMRSLGYFRSLPGGGQVNRIVLCGGGACLRNIIPYLQKQLGMEVRIAQPLAGLAIAPPAQQASEHPEQSSVALGLALRCCENVHLEINLIPPRILESARQKEQAFYWILSLATLALIMASIIPVSANDNDADLQQNELLNRFIHMYDPELAIGITATGPLPGSTLKLGYESSKKKVKTLTNYTKFLDNKRLARTFWLDEMSLVNDARPETGGIWFHTVESTRIVSVPVANNPAAFTSTGYQGSGGSSGGFSGGSRGRGAGGRRGRPGGRAAGGASGVSGARDARAARDARRAPRGAGAPPVAGADPAAATGGLPAGGRAARRMRGRAAATPAPAAAAPPVDTSSNGLIIRGYAESDLVINEFVENLKLAKRTLPNRNTLVTDNVYFREASVELVPPSALYSPPAGAGGNRASAGQSTSSRANAGGGNRAASRGRGRRGGGARNNGNRATGFTSTNISAGNRLYSFTMHIKFSKLDNAALMKLNAIPAGNNQPG